MLISVFVQVGPKEALDAAPKLMFLQKHLLQHRDQRKCAHSRMYYNQLNYMHGRQKAMSAHH